MKHSICMRRIAMLAALAWGFGLAPALADVVVFDEDDAAGEGYYDASVPIVAAPSLLTTVGSPYGGKLPILTNQAFSGSQSTLLEWNSASGGSWTVFIASPGFQVWDLTGYSNVVLFVNGPKAIAAANLPRLGLESSANKKTPTISLGSFLTEGLDADTDSWQRIVIPLTAFEPFGQFSPVQFKDVFFTQGNPDNVTRTVWLDNLRVAGGGVPSAPVGVVTRAGDRSVVLHWERSPEGNVAGYRIYRRAGPDEPFRLLSTPPAVLPSCADFAVTNGQQYTYLVRALSGAGDESGDSMSVNATPQPFASDTAFLEYLQQTTFDFFWYEANPTNGLIRDRSQPNSVVSVAGVGFGLTGINIAIEHGWISREQGRQRVLATLRTFHDGPQGPAVSGTIGHKGWFYHMLGLNTATRDGDSELSSIDTALLLAGVLDVRQFFDQDQPEETLIRSLADAIFRRVDWQWMANGGNSLTMGWKPESGFLPWRWQGYNEAMILYILGLGVATNPLPSVHWSSWTSSYAWRTNHGYAYVEFPPLFGHQFSHCWIDFRHIADGYMNSRGISYFENSRRATLAQRAYCMANPGRFAGYGSNVWGITACDGPGFGVFYSYAARGAPPGQNDDGTLAPTAVGGSLPFAPEVCLPTLRYLYDRYRTNLWSGHGFRDAFNLTADWWGPDVLSIDQGAILLMAENYRSQNVWRRFMQIPEVQRGLRAAGFANLASVPLGIQRGAQAGTFLLTWPTRSKATYQLEYSPDLNAWFIPPTGALTATGETLYWTDTPLSSSNAEPADVGQRFYRVFRFGPP